MSRRPPKSLTSHFEPPGSSSFRWRQRFSTYELPKLEALEVPAAGDHREPVVTV